VIAAKKLGLACASEVFADRTYQDNGSLTPRTQGNALITDEDQSLKQVLMMVNNQQVVSASQKVIPLKADTLCLHGDGVHAVEFAKTIHETLINDGITIKAPSR